MFRDLKEYQEIAKIYTEKVSKPENLEEMTGLGVQGAQKMQKDIKSGELKQKPEMKNLDKGKTFIEKGGIAGAIKRVFQRKSREEVGLKPKQFQGRISRSSQNMSGKPKPEIKKFPTTAEIRAKDKAAGGDGMSNIPKAEGSAVIDGKKLNPDFGKKVEIKNEPKISKFTKQGKPRTKAQMMAAKRIASGKSIQDVKDANTDAMKKRAEQRFKDFKAKRDAFKARRAEKKLDKQRDFDDPDKRMNRGESYTPYDIVLEYLLSTEQVATIEEANYVMTEMDAETIQGIVEEQKKTLDEMDMMKMPVINVLGGVGSAIAGTVAAAKYLGRKAGERAIKKEGEKPGKPGLIKTIKDRTDATNKAIEKMKNP